MKCNVGIVDRTIRYVISIMFAVMGFILSPWWFIISIIALVTGLLGKCGIYSLLGISTCKKVAKKQAKKKKSRKSQ